MPRLINGRRPSRRTTLWLSLGLFILGCVLALLERILTVFAPIENEFIPVFARVTPLITLVLVMPLCLSLRHFRHPRPYWLYPLAVTLMAGLFGYVLLFHNLPREELPQALPSDPWWLTVILVMGIWLISVGIASVAISALHLFWKPTLKPVCERCGYLLQGLRSDHCPECGESVAPLSNQVEGN